MAAPNASATGTEGLHVHVISPEQTVYDDQADSVVVPAWDGELGVLRGHAPLMAVLGSGVMRVTRAGNTQKFHVEGGFVQVVDDVVTVLSEKAEALT